MQLLIGSKEALITKLRTTEKKNTPVQAKYWTGSPMRGYESLHSRQNVENTDSYIIRRNALGANWKAVLRNERTDDHDQHSKGMVGEKKQGTIHIFLF